MQETVQKWVISMGVAENTAELITWIVLALGIITLAYVCHFIARKFLLAGVRYMVKKTQTEWDDYLLKRKFFSRLSHLAPALVIYLTAYLFPSVQEMLQRISMVYMILAGLLAVNGLLTAATDIYSTFEISRQRPIKGYVQVVKIILAVAIAIIAVSTLMDKSPWILLSGLGAMTAVLLLVFKDSILGLVAGIQLSANDMVRIGDWIEMPRYGADGDVIDVSLNTVKVQNFDKTITTIPAYSLISDSFKNWRGMNESEGRRIKRAIHIDMASIRFCTPEMLDDFERFQLLTDYLKAKRLEVSEYNREIGTDTSRLINGRNLTNVGTFRAYLEAYLRAHPKIHTEMTFLVRQLPPSDNGLPIEIYVFSNDQNWIRYEAIQADIFDHLLAVVPEFGLRLFQRPTGADIQHLAGTLSQPGQA